MKFVHNTFDEKREIAGFSKDELIEIKKKISEYKSNKIDQSEFMEILQSKFSEELLEGHSKYIEKMVKFIESYFSKFLTSAEEHQYNFYYLKSGLLEELELISKNLLNLKLNAQNTKRFLKDNSYLDSYITQISNITEINKDLQLKLKKKGDPPIKYEELSHIWLEINRIKNLQYKVIDTEELEIWEEFSNLVKFLKKKGEKEVKGGLFSKKEAEVIFEFKILNDYISSSQQENFNFYCDLYYLLYVNDILSELKEQEFSNILERKEVKIQLRDYMRSIIKDLIFIKLDNFIQEIKSFKEGSEYDKEDIKGDIDNLKNEKIKNLLPKLVDLYFIGLENQYQSLTTNIQDIQKFDEIIDEYSEKIDRFYDIIENIKDYTSNYNRFLKPYEEMLVSLRKIFSNLLEDIYRRKGEFNYYLEAIKKERMKEDIRSFTSEKINELNSLIEKYRDEIAILLKEKMPQLESVEEIIITYKDQINKIKDDLYHKLREHEKKDLDQYQIIKQWEENYKRSKEQIGFLLSQYLTNLYKDFEGIIEKEEALFERVKEITKYSGNQEELPLNYAFSTFLSDKLTEEELRERMVELKAKLNKLRHLEMLYEDELSQLKDNLETKVKIREGISTSNVECSVCRKKINFAKDKIIKCPYCGAVYHYLCVAFWLSKYNSCPSCQNVFLDPNQNIYEAQPEE
ncbi:MAG: hypothetical protein EU518_00780 [Promethearchaeota archaeon]|nr:MAG: hypothetical protein EU518_00780 [Candidatus Lokiarchaeota archaeon]